MANLSSSGVNQMGPTADVVVALDAEENVAPPGGDTAGDQQVGEQQAIIKNSTASLDETPPLQVLQVGKPQVIVRIRPSSPRNMDYSENNVPIFEVDRQSNTVQIRVDRDERKTPGLTSKHKPPPGHIYFPADKILEDSISQEDTFAEVAGEVVEKAMAGIPGIIVTIGPEMSGKSYSLFGLSGKYQNRGIAVRALEKMFDIKDRKQGDIDFKFGIAIIEVRRERIRDLLTLSSHEINEMGDRGPKGMYVEEVDCLEQALGLMLRAFIGQKLIHLEPFERYHTIVYLEIIAVNPIVPELVEYQSRITLAEIASAAYKMESLVSPSNSSVSMLCRSTNESQQQFPVPFKTDNKLTKLLTQQLPVLPSRKCCNPGQTTGPLAESIAVRRDVFALEQIFLRAGEMNRIRKYFAKMENLGLSMIASEKKKMASVHHFRHNKLAHCLKDILDSNMEIRIVLHVRPDKAYLKSSLEAMRFAERARLVPSNLDEDPNKGKPNRTEEQILQEVIQDIAPELMHPVDVESLNSEKMKVIQEQAVHYFQNNIEEMKVCSKEKVKLMFENFRVLWNFLWELELNVTLRKAEEEMKQAIEKMGAAAAESSVVPPSGNVRRRNSEKRGSDFGGVDDDDHLDKLGNKKSLRRLKKEKERKKKKERQAQQQQQQQDKRTSSNEIKGGDDMKLMEGEFGGGKLGSGVDVGAGGETEGIGEQGAVAEDDEKPTNIKGETEVSDTSPPGTTEQPQALFDNVGDDNIHLPIGGIEPLALQKLPSGRESIKRIKSISNEREPYKKISVEDVAAEQTSNNNMSSDVPTLTGEKIPEVDAHGVTSNAEAFPDFKSSFMGSHEPEKKVLTEEDRAQLAAQQEQQISENFEEMKKVARRQAIHLLKAGIKRPQWLSQF